MENVIRKLEAEGTVKKGVYSVAFKMNSPGLYLVLKGSKYGVINKEGKVLISPRYICVSSQIDGTYRCLGVSNKYFFTDTYDSQFNLV